MLLVFIKEPLSVLDEGLGLEDSDGQALRCGTDGHSRLRLHPSGEGRARLAEQAVVRAQRTHSLLLDARLTSSFLLLWRELLLVTLIFVDVEWANETAPCPGQSRLGRSTLRTHTIA